MRIAKLVLLQLKRKQIYYVVYLFWEGAQGETFQRYIRILILTGLANQIPKDVFVIHMQGQFI